MKLLDDYENARKKLFAYFGYKEDWQVIPVDDGRKFYWSISGEGQGSVVRFGETVKILHSEDGYYENEIYCYHHLPKWVYQGKEYTLIVVDTHTDGNKFLQIFDNSKKVKWESNEKMEPENDI